jgi:translation initiation factor 1A
MATHVKRHKKNTQSSELILKEHGQEYAKVLALMGEGRVQAMCADGVERICHIRGTLRKKVWIVKDDILLISLRDFQDKKADILVKYCEQEVRQLRSMGEISTIDKVKDSVEDIDNQLSGGTNTDSGFDFDAI